ncbi:reverse gyrase [Sulfolobus sp. A20-N-F6]|nr:reverse gyrase [Sulfolobus sp. A20-N-F6]
MINIKYLNACPNCGNEISSSRLIKGLPCDNCLQDVNHIDIQDQLTKIKTIYEILINNGKIINYWSLYYNVSLYEKVFEYFRRKTGYQPWSLQKLWLKRLVDNQSFTLSAPTGLGKTTTLMVYSTYLNEDVVYIVPTKSLVDQVCERLRKLGGEVSCGKVEDHKLNVITVSYLNKNSDTITVKPKLVIIDDADAVVKSGKTTDRLVSLLGVPREVYNSAIQLTRLKQKFLLNSDNDEIKERIRDLELKIASFNEKISQLVVASATIRPKGIKQKALRLLTGFEPASVQLYARNIIDSYEENLDLSIIQKLGSGGLILVSKELGRDMMKKIKDEIQEFGLETKLAISGRRFLDEFSSGKVDVLIGSASYYGVAVRGIDEPKKLKYVVFYGVPKTRIKLYNAISNPFTLLRVAKVLGLDVSRIQNDVLFLNYSEAQLIRYSILNNEDINNEKLQRIKSNLLEYISLIKDKLKDINSSTIISDNFVISYENSSYYMTYPDVITYLQGSGRSSRLYNGGLTLGLSIVLIDNKLIFEILKRRLQRMLPEIAFKELSELNLDMVKQQLDSSRRDEGERTQFSITTGLLVVESPTKARTIAKLFGRPSIKLYNRIPVYETIIVDGKNIYVMNIVATKGHITDLTTDKLGYYGVKVDDSDIIPYYVPLSRCLDCNKIFSSTNYDKCPYCGSENVYSSKAIIDLLRHFSLFVEKIYIASDPDAEGEKIAFDVSSLISPYNSEVYRVKYHEITKNAILNALRNPQKVDVNLVMSQVARRVEDRWIGFELSKILKNKFNDFNQGAGRVQTPVLGWIVNRTMNYKSNLGYIVYIDINGYIIKKYFKDRKSAEEYLKSVEKISIEKVNEQKILLSPLPPFTTDSLLIEANSRFKFTANLTMKIAQELFEAGLITYHRTDSTHISSVGVAIAKEYLEKHGLSLDFIPRNWSSDEEGAHEGIRPTRAIDVNELVQEIEENPFRYPIRFTKYHFMLYDLIFRRFIASQMKHSIGIKTKYKIIMNENDYIEAELISSTIGGFAKIYDIKTHNLPIGEINPRITLSRGSSEQLPTYSDIISLMKSKGIGRPSTYAKTIENLLRHGYVISSKKRSYLIATRRGINVYQYLSSKFPHLISDERTSKLMSILDDISLGRINASNVLIDVYSEILSSVNSLKLEQDV